MSKPAGWCKQVWMLACCCEIDVEVDFKHVPNERNFQLLWQH